MKTSASILLILSLCVPLCAVAQESAVADTGVEPARQCIVWSSGDREVALKLVFMYAYYSKKQGWMDQVRLLVWGPSAKLLSVDSELQTKLEELKEMGVELLACKACTDSYGVSEKLEQLGITVRYTGKDLAEMQKTGWHVLTF